MDTFYGFLIFAAICVALYIFKKLVGKSINTVSKVANQNLLFREEHQEAGRLREPMVYKTKAAANEIFASIDSHIVTGELNLAVPVVYRLNANNDAVLYAFGYKLKPKIFAFSISVSKKENYNEVTFKVTNWIEINGMTRDQDQMRTLRRQVQTAIEAVGGENVS